VTSRGLRWRRRFTRVVGPYAASGVPCEKRTRYDRGVDAAATSRRVPSGAFLRLSTAVLFGLSMLLPSVVAHAQEQLEEPSARQSIEAALEMDTYRQAQRLPRVTLDAPTGDLTVIFAMRRPLADDPRQIVASATDDVFTILWAVYTSAAAPRIRTATVLGTYAVVGRYERPREVPLLRAVLSADRAVRLDWWNTASLDPRDALDTWWVEGELVAMGASP
jgi:hypothetical protein